MEIKLTNVGFLIKRKLLIILMRTFIFLCCATVFSFTPSNVLSQNSKIKIDVDKTLTVDEVFDLIMDQTDYRFMYEKGLFKNFPNIELKKGVIRTNKLLNQSLSNSSFNIIVTADNKILIKEKSPKDKQLQKRVSGRVTDRSGLPIAGATVLIKGTTTGVATNFDGSYNITVPDPQSVLVISSLGFKDQEITVGNQLQINVELEEDVATLDEVVVTGYQNIAKERSTGAYAKPDMEIVDNRSTSMNVIQRLEGLVPGLVINNAPNGSDANKIQIRGLSSLNGNQTPLFVVDGVTVTNIESINPQDVEDITVLKDAVAASIYGSQSSNGVIVITTKRGGFNSKIKVDYDMFTNFQGKPDLNYFPVLNSQEFIQTAKEVFDPITFPYIPNSTYGNSTKTALNTHYQILYDQDNGLIDKVTADARLDQLANTNNLDQIEDLLYRNAMLTNHTLSVQSGGQNHSVYGSLAYTNAQSSRPGEKDETFKINLRQDFKFGKRVKLRLNTDLTNRITEAKRNIQVDNRFLPYAMFKNPDGTNAHMEYVSVFSRDERALYEQASGINLDYVPLDDINSGYTDTNTLNARISAGISVDLFKGLQFEGTYGYEHQNGKSASFDTEDSYAVRSDLIFFTVPAVNPGDDPTYHLPITEGYYKTSNGLTKNWTFRNQLNYHKDWNDGLHKISVLAGQETRENFLNVNNTTTIGFNPRTLLSPNLNYELLNDGVSGVIVGNRFTGNSTLNLTRNGARTPPYVESEILLRFKSYFATGSYTLNNKYTVSGSWRIDESSLFGIDKSAQNRPVWSTGFKWIASSEKFLENVQWIDHLAFRSSYGITGNAPRTGQSSSFDLLQTSPSSHTEAPFTNRISSAGNKSLTWESTENLNFGLDFGLFNNRLRGTFDYYKNNTEQLLGFLETNTFTGFSQIFGNAGDLENTGVELGLQTVNIKGEFSWQTGLVLGHNKNVITSLNSETVNNSIIGMLGSEFVEGYSASPLFAYDFVGLNNEGNPEIRLADGTIVSNQNAAEVEDVKYMGTYQPIWSGNLSNSFYYKGLSLTANIIYNLGHVMLLDSPGRYSGKILDSHISSLVIRNGNVHADFDNRWRQPGDEAFTNIPGYQVSGGLDRDASYYTYGDINVESASYIKLRDITLGYSLPDTVLNKLNASNISLRLQVNNLMLWKANTKNIDPEFHFAKNGTRTTPTDQGTITLGLHITF